MLSIMQACVLPAPYLPKFVSPRCMFVRQSGFYLLEIEADPLETRYSEILRLNQPKKGLQIPNSHKGYKKT
jgi:hypothetical protein